MATTIEQLELEVQSSSQSAVSGIDALASSLEKLKSATSGVNLGGVSQQLTKINNALSGMNGQAIKDVAGGLYNLSYLNRVNIPANLGSELKKIGSAVQSMSGVDFQSLYSLGAALKSMSAGSATLNIGHVTQEMKKLPELMKVIGNLNMTDLKMKLNQLSGAFAPLAANMEKIHKGFTALRPEIEKTTSSTQKSTEANEKNSNSWTNLVAKVYAAKTAVQQAARVIGSWITQSNKYVEDLNLFTASMGEYAQQAQNYAEKVGDLMGIDPAEWMRNQGVFMTITKGFGVASDRAYIMSQNLTQLGYDLSSFFNISYEDAMQKLQSGISGELEPLRRLGYDLSVARLQQEALNLGINESVNSMTQAEKAQLRYYAIMTQVTVAQGDMARTLNAPANQLRVLQAQVTQAARALGNIFIPLLNLVLPYAIAAAKAIRFLANSIASLFGFKLPEIDYSGIKSDTGGIAKNLDDAGTGAGNLGKGLGKAAKAAKKTKDYLLGIDELNVLRKEDPTTSSGSGGSGGGSGLGGVGGGAGGLDFDLPTYDFIGDLVQTKVDKIIETIKGALAEITAIASGFALAIGTILVVTGANIPLGLGLMVIGAIGLAKTIAENWNGMSERLAKTLTIITATLGGFLLAIGAIMTFTGVNVPLGIGLMVAGAVSLATAVTINWKFLNGDLSNALSILTAIVGGAMLAIGALLAVSGVNVPLGIALIAAGALSLAAAIGLNWDGMPEKVEKVIATLTAIVGGALLAIGALLTFSGGNIPFGIAMLAAGAISVVTSVVLNWNSIAGSLKGTLGLITAIVSGALIALGAVIAFSGAGLPLGIGLMAAGAVGLVAMLSINWSSITEKIKGVLKAIGIAVGAALIALGAILAFTGVGIPIGVALMAAGAASLIAGVALNWETIKEKIKSVLKSIGIIAGGALLALGVILCLTGVGIPLGVALIAAGAASLVAGVALNWGAIKEKIGSGLKAISEKFGEFKGWVKGKLDETKEHIKTWASNTKEWFTKGKDGKGIVDHFKDTAEKITGKFGEKIGTASARVKENVQKWGANVKEWFTKGSDGKNIVDHFKETAGNIVEGFKSKLEKAKDKVKDAVEGWGDKVKNWFKDKLGIHSPSTVFADIADDVINGFKNTIDSDSGDTKSGITSWASNVKNWFTGDGYGGVNLKKFSDFAKNAISGFKDKVANGYTDTKSGITTWASKVKEWYTSDSFGGVNGTKFGDFAQKAITGFKDIIGSKYTDSKSNLTTWASKAKEWFTSDSFGGVNSTKFGTFAQNVITGFKNIIGSKYTDSKSNLTTWASKAKEWFTSDSFGGVNSTKFGGYALNVINGFKDTIGSKYSTAKSNMTTFASNVRSYFTSDSHGKVNSTTFGGFASSVISGFASGITGNYKNTKNPMETFGSKMKGWFTAYAKYGDNNSGFYGVAKNVVDGFKNGIGNLYSTVKNNIQTWGGSIITWFKNKLGVKSPSRVFYEIGGFTVEGFNNAISNIGDTTRPIVQRWADSFTDVAPTLALAVDTSALDYYDASSFDKQVRASVSHNSMITADGFRDGMEEFYTEYMQPLMTQMAEDMRRQADKEEQTIVQVGNRVISDAVTQQRNANGFRFVTEG